MAIETNTDQNGSAEVVPAQYLFPFILVTSLFALWGFANDFTNPLVAAFKDIYLISNFQSSLVQFAFYGGYATMAIPAALVIRKYSYRTGIVAGLLLYATGALLTIPASLTNFWVFLIAFYILTFGLAFLETTANPYVLSLGAAKTATQRLNLAQAFNPIGSLTGMIVASQLILPNLDVDAFKAEQRENHPEYSTMSESEVNAKLTSSLEDLAKNETDRYQEMKDHDLRTVRIPYVCVAVIVLFVMALFLISKMPDTGHSDEKIRTSEVLQHLAHFRYLGGVVAQAFYVGAQIMCWTFIVHYGQQVMGYSLAEAQQKNIIAMGIFLCSRFICTFILKYLKPGLLLGLLALGGILLTLGTILLPGIIGLYCLIGISACMSLMFPTIYGIALDGLTPDDAKLASAGLIFAIVGGALMPPLQGKIIDMGSNGTIEIFGRSIDSVRISFVLPLICFVVIAIYGFMTHRKHSQERVPA